MLVHATSLSNFARGYDRYRRIYSKSDIPESSFPDRFFLLPETDLEPGLRKAERLVAKLGIPGDRPILIRATVAPGETRADHASGIGCYVPRNWIDVASVAWLDRDSEGHPHIRPALVEEIAAASLGLLEARMKAWADCRPRTISVLPIGLACQASCRFCFSKASVSAEFRGRIDDWRRIELALDRAHAAGAERAVITGGGEPTLLKEHDLLALISACRTRFGKVVLITNGDLITRQGAEVERMRHLAEAGLGVLAISRHHHQAERAAGIMGLDVPVERIAQVAQTGGISSTLRLRLICVLQKDGIATPEDIEAYLSWAAALGIQEVNFKELYVSTGLESAYSDLEANAYSARMQVPLRIVHDFAERHGWPVTQRLPWGAPVFEGAWNGRQMRIAAYTEPSVYWERMNGVVRSWNLMSDGRCLASLEDMTSEVDL